MLQKLIAFCLLLISSVAWAEGTTSLTTGFDYSSGKFGGTTSTNILYIPVIGRYQTDDYYLRLTVPYLSISSVGTVIRGVGTVRKPRTVTSTEIITQSGLGDVTTSAGYTVFETDELMVDLVGGIKFGTADASKNLGTGENDYSSQLDGFYTIRKTTLFATAGYRVIGVPAGLNLRNVAYGTLGFSQKTSDKTSAGVTLDTAQSINAINPSSRELSFFVSNKLNKTSKIQASFLKGLSDNSPDFGFSMMITGTI